MYLLVYWPLRGAFGVLAEIARKRGPRVFVGLFWLWVLSAVLQLILIPSQRARQLPMNFETLISVAAAWATSDVWFRRFHKPEHVGLDFAEERKPSRRDPRRAYGWATGWSRDSQPYPRMARPRRTRQRLSSGSGLLPDRPAVALGTLTGSRILDLGWGNSRWPLEDATMDPSTVPDLGGDGVGSCSLALGPRPRMVLSLWLSALLLFAGLLVLMGRYTRRVARSPT